MVVGKVVQYYNCLALYQKKKMDAINWMCFTHLTTFLSNLSAHFDDCADLANFTKNFIQFDSIKSNRVHTHNYLIHKRIYSVDSLNIAMYVHTSWSLMIMKWASKTIKQVFESWSLLLLLLFLHNSVTVCNLLSSFNTRHCQALPIQHSTQTKPIQRYSKLETYFPAHLFFGSVEWRW